MDAFDFSQFRGATDIPLFVDGAKKLGHLVRHDAPAVPEEVVDELVDELDNLDELIRLLKQDLSHAIAMYD